VTRGVLLCEGSDDLSALREILDRIFGFARAPSIRPDDKRETWAQGDIVVELVLAKDRERVLSTAASLLSSNSPSDPATSLGLCFDPNGQDEAAWRSWIEAKIQVRRAGWHYLAQRLPATPLGAALDLFLK
jgi:hypothetical protein